MASQFIVIELVLSQETVTNDDPTPLTTTFRLNIFFSFLFNYYYCTEACLSPSQQAGLPMPHKASAIERTFHPQSVAPLDRRALDIPRHPAKIVLDVELSSRD